MPFRKKVIHIIKIVQGNILDAPEDIICHQVNTKSVMGAGLAKQIRNKYPEVYPSYQRYCKGCKDGNPQNLLGEVQTILCSDGKIVANLFGQYDYGRDKQYTDYNALKQSLESILTIAKMFNDSIAIPYGIGCGLAGGSWDIVYSIIEEVFKDYDVTIYQLEKR